MQALAKSIDHKLVAALIVVLLLYTGVTINAVTRIPSLSDNSTPFFEEDLMAHHQQEDQEQDQRLPPTLHQKLADIKDIETLQHTFPIHVGDDTQEIDHPGAFFADKNRFKQILKSHPALPRKMLVPTFFRPNTYGPDGVRAFLGDHGNHLITPEQARQIGSFDPRGLETIYVSVASYRDPECQPTIEDLYERALHPERIRVAIIDQRAQGDPICSEPTSPCNENPNQVMCKYRHLIDVFEVEAPLSVGPVFARHLAHRMYRGEYFAMQVDSHVRFIEHWDDDLIRQWKSAKNEMAVMTTYLSDIIGSIDPTTHENRHPARPIMCKTDYESQGALRHLRHGQQPEGPPGIIGEPTLHPFWAAGFSFARGHFVVQVPYDQYLPMVFQGEEISIGLRGFTYGYDYYTAERSVAFHIYAIGENKERRKKINLFWENTNLYPGSNVEGMKRLNGIIGMGNPGDEFYHAEEDDYGLGQVRNKEHFFKLYGIHTDTKTVEDHLCTFVGKPMQNMFLPFLRSNGMGIDYSKITFEYKDAKAVKAKKVPHRNP
jgi:[Skp1-protein]-hydroxyproline N-acetylglucosaminyltransferase